MTDHDGGSNGDGADGPILHSQRVTEQIVDYLRDEIVSGRLEDGEPLRLIALAQRLGVSTTPVREALAILERQGLATSQPNRGFRVTRVSEVDLGDALLLYGYLRSALARRSLESLDEEGRDGLYDLGRRAINATESNDPQAAALARSFLDHLVSGDRKALLNRFLDEVEAFTSAAAPARQEIPLGLLRGLVAALEDDEPDRIVELLESYTVDGATASGSSD